MCVEGKKYSKTRKKKEKEENCKIVSDSKWFRVEKGKLMDWLLAGESIARDKLSRKLFAHRREASAIKPPSEWIFFFIFWCEKRTQKMKKNWKRKEEKDCQLSVWWRRKSGGKLLLFLRWNHFKTKEGVVNFWVYFGLSADWEKYFFRKEKKN